MFYENNIKELGRFLGNAEFTLKIDKAESETGFRSYQGTTYPVSVFDIKLQVKPRIDTLLKDDKIVVKVIFPTTEYIVRTNEQRGDTRGFKCVLKQFIVKTEVEMGDFDTVLDKVIKDCQDKLAENVALLSKKDVWALFIPNVKITTVVELM